MKKEGLENLTLTKHESKREIKEGSESPDKVIWTDSGTGNGSLNKGIKIVIGHKW